MAWRKKKRPPGAEPFDVTLPEGAEAGAELAEAASREGWTIERVGTLVADGARLGLGRSRLLALKAIGKWPALRR